ncbi:MAG: hypothetical protein Q9195_006752 [Heterodermia aff. obscurata]
MSGDSASQRVLVTHRGDEITLEEALEEEQNMLVRLTFLQKFATFRDYLENHRKQIEAAVSHHLNLGRNDSCSLGHMREWIHGSFNMCLPLRVTRQASSSQSRVMIRFPLPYKIGEEYHPGNADEKLRCEAATYIFIQDNCPDIPVPKLLGFAFSGNECFTAIANTSWYTRLIEYFRRQLFSLLRQEPRCSYVGQPKTFDLMPGYLLLEHIEKADGEMLMYTWDEERHDKNKRTNLFRDLSRIMLSLGRVPLPRIGSFTINDEGVLSLTNWPLTYALHDLENEGVPTDIARNQTYTPTEQYVLDTLAYHENLLRYRPNSIHDETDCLGQMAALTGMRAVLPHFVNRDLHNGPFQLTLTDLHPPNIYVDHEWHIKYIIDLEWACSLPIEMQSPPHWLNNRGIDELEDNDYREYNVLREEFMEAFEIEEKLIKQRIAETGSLWRTRTMNEVWNKGKFFYFHALMSTKGLFNVVNQHILGMYPSTPSAIKQFDDVFSPFWNTDADQVTAKKLEDKEEYRTALRKFFENTPRVVFDPWSTESSLTGRK